MKLLTWKWQWARADDGSASVSLSCLGQSGHFADITRVGGSWYVRNDDGYIVLAPSLDLKDVMRCVRDMVGAIVAKRYARAS